MSEFGSTIDEGKKGNAQVCLVESILISIFRKMNHYHFLMVHLQSTILALMFQIQITILVLIALMLYLQRTNLALHSKNMLQNKKLIFFMINNLIQYLNLHTLSSRPAIISK